MEVLVPEDSNTIQVLYGFVLIALAVLIATKFVGDPYVLTGVMAMLLLKDGIPNFILGAVKIAKKEKV